MEQQMYYFIMDISKINVYFEVERVHKNVCSENKNVVVKYGGEDLHVSPMFLWKLADKPACCAYSMVYGSTQMGPQNRKFVGMMSRWI